uniref:Protein zwilch n=1 Tax=Varanus komodoensis TaxID=61221 RepID=A0A8D2Q7W6_VARKO
AVFFSQTDLQGYLIGEGCASPLDVFWDRSGVMFVVEKVVSCISSIQTSMFNISYDFASVSRQLISFYTMSQNPNMNLTLVLLPPLWVRCDRSDLKQTIWLGAEPLSTGNKIIGINLYTVTCKVSKKKYSADLEELKEMHRMRHHSSNLTVKGFARYEFLDATPLDSLALEDTLISLERNIYVDFAWNTVTKLLQTPSLTSAATLVRTPPPGCCCSTRVKLLQNQGHLMTGLTDWPKPVGGKPAVELVQKLLEGNFISPQSTAAALPGSMKTLFSRRGDLDFVELLWCKMWGKVTSYAELVECFSQVMKAIQHGALQTWVHQGSSSLLSKLIKQSYYGSVDTVPLRGVTPVQMLLEIGVDKMKRDYATYFFLGPPPSLSKDYFMSTSVDLQEQIHRVQKLHHMLEIVDNCVELLKLEHESLIFLTQSCINYYKENPLNEKHVFQLPVRATLVKEFYQNAHPQVWRVEISSGRGQGKVTTAWQLSTTPPAEHLCSSGADILDTEACGSKEEMSFVTLLECSQVPFA